MMTAVDGSFPYPARDIIEEMVQEDHTNNEIFAALAQQGLITSEKSLQRRI
jgi:hypothetical protein